MRDDLTDGLRYAVKPQLLVAYLVAFVGEFVRRFWLTPPIDPGTTVYEVLSFVLGPFNFLLDLAGYVLVAIGTVAVLWIVLSDVFGNDATPELPSFGSSDDGSDAGSTDDADDGKPAHSADPAAEDARGPDSAGAGDATGGGDGTDAGDATGTGDETDSDDGPWTDN